MEVLKSLYEKFNLEENKKLKESLIKTTFFIVSISLLFIYLKNKDIDQYSRITFEKNIFSKN